jgi:alkylation response protein AidB-like acyl-CoA dehydrogenase
MDFALSAEQLRLRREIVEFAEAELSPGAVDRDRRRTFPRGLWRRCGELRLHGLAVPEAYGGRGLDALSTAVALEGLGYGCSDGGLVFSLGAHLLACAVPLWKFGTESQKRRWLPDLCAGRRIGALAMTEAESGSDAYALATGAEPDGDGYRIDGAKTLITNAPVADLAIVGARAPEGVTAFLVDMGLPGVERGAPFDTLGLRTAPLGGMRLSGVRVGADAVLGRPGGGGAVFQEAMDWERTCLFASHVGTMQWLVDAAVARARERRIGGRPISSHQAVAHKIADLEVQLEAARLLTYRAAWQLARGRSATREAAIAKLFVSESLVRAALDTLQIHGGQGLLTDVEIERRLRDAAGSTIYSGTSEIQRNLIAGMLGLCG